MSQLLQLFAKPRPGFPGTAYVFNGVDMYVTLPPWTPLGIPWSITMPFGVTAFDTGDEQVLWRAGNGAPHVTLTSTGGETQANYEDTSDNNINLDVVIQIEVGTVQTSRFTALPTGGKNEILGLSAENSNPPKSSAMDAVNTLAASSTGAKTFKGIMWNVAFTDDAPVQDQWTTASNGVRVCNLANDIVIPVQDLFEATFEMILGADPLTGFVDFAGQSGGNAYVRWYGTTHASFPNQLGLQSSVVGEFRFELPTFFESDGSHTKLSIVNSSTGVVIAKIDDTTLPPTAIPLAFGDAVFNIIGGNGSGPLPTGWTAGRVAIRNNSTGENWDYLLDEESGDIAFESGVHPPATNVPITNTDAMIGDQARHLVLGADIDILNGEEFEIKFDWIRQNSTGGSAYSLFGVIAGAANKCFAWDTDSANPNQLTLRISNTAITFVAMEGIRLGGHVSVRFTYVGGVLSCFVNDVPKGTVIVDYSTGFFDALYAGSGSPALPAGSALQNWSLENFTTGETWFYAMDEGTGLTSFNTGNTGNTFDGTWTPNVDWQFIPPADDYNGTWTDDQGKVFIPDNSRFYPFDDRTGSTVRDSIGGHDGTIVGFVENNWRGDGLRILDAVAAPDGVVGGIPYEAGLVAVDTVSAIHHYHQGIPFTANGRLATSLDSTIVRVGNGAAPFAADNRLAFGTGDVQSTLAGVNYDVGSRVRANEEEVVVYDPITDSPNWSTINGVPNWESSIINQGVEVVRVKGTTSPESSIAFGAINAADVEISQNIRFQGTSTNSASFLGAVRITNANNFIGWRTYQNQIQVFQRSGGAFTQLLNNGGAFPQANLGSEVKMKVVGSLVTMTINGVEYPSSVPVTILGAGRVGSIPRAWTIGARVVFENFAAVAI